MSAEKTAHIRSRSKWLGGQLLGELMGAADIGHLG